MPLLDAFLHDTWRDRHVDVEAVETRDVLVVFAPGMVMGPEVLIQLRICVDGEDALFLSSRGGGDDQQP